jgi:hypothetical protein
MPLAPNATTCFPTLGLSRSLVLGQDDKFLEALQL